MFRLFLVSVITIGLVGSVGAEGSATYTVVKGDSLYKIAREQLGSSNRWYELAQINRIRAPYLIQPGQVIKLSAERPSVAAVIAPYFTPEADANPTSYPEPQEPAKELIPKEQGNSAVSKTLGTSYFRRR